MPDLAASDITYTKNRVEDANGMKKWYGTVAFGNGSLTYPTGGVPSAISKYGFARQLVSWIAIESNADGLIYEYDKSASTIRIMEANYADTGDGPLVELDGGSDAPAATTLVIEATGY